MRRPFRWERYGAAYRIRDQHGKLTATCWDQKEARAICAALNALDDTKSVDAVEMTFGNINRAQTQAALNAMLGYLVLENGGRVFATMDQLKQVSASHGVALTVYDNGEIEVYNVSNESMQAMKEKQQETEQ